MKLHYSIEKIFSSPKVNKKLLEDIEKFMIIEDLDELDKMNQYLVDNYDIQEIQKAFEKKFDVNKKNAEQAYANILFHPNLLPKELKFNLQKQGIENEFNSYCLLATVVGLQGDKFLEPNGEEVNYFTSIMYGYLKDIFEDEIIDDFSLTLVNRMINTLLHPPFAELLIQVDQAKEFIQIFASCLNSEKYSKLYRNMKLLFTENFVLMKEEEMASYFKKEVWKEISELRDIKKKDKSERSSEELLLSSPTYAHIPNLRDFG